MRLKNITRGSLAFTIFDLYIIKITNFIDAIN